MSNYSTSCLGGRLEVRLGGDPRGCVEFVTLRAELSKLDHPARPDVDWPRVEGGCLALLQRNGAELQTLAAMTLARAHFYGLPSLTQSIGLLNSLLEFHAARLWPPLAQARVETLGWLCGHLHTWFRGWPSAKQDVPLLIQLEAELVRLEVLQQGLALLTPHRAFRQAIASRVLGLEALDGATHSVSAQLPGAGMMSGPPAATALAMSVPAPITLAFTPANPPPAFARVRSYLSAGLLGLALVAGAGGAWWHAAAPEPAPASILLRLDDLFDAGSAHINAKAMPTLISALADIKAQARGLVVVGGHSDASGTVQKNLELSHARATAVRDWLQQVGGLAAGCLAVRAHADNQPLVSNETAAGRAINRRVDIQLMPQDATCG